MEAQSKDPSHIGKVGVSRGQVLQTAALQLWLDTRA